MANPPIDDLIDTIETVKVLKDTIAKHGELLGRIIDELTALRSRLDGRDPSAPTRT